MKKLILIILLSSFNVYGAGLVKAKYAGEFMATGVGARSLAMGGAFVAVGGDVTAGYWNPAALVHVDYPQIIAMYAERFARLVNYNYGAVAMPAGAKTTLALSVIRLGVDDIPYTALQREDLELGAVYDGNKLNTPYIARMVSDAEWAVYLSFAKNVSSRFAWGSNIKIVTKQIGDDSAWGIGFDAGMLYSPYKNFNVGVNFQDATTTLLAWSTGRREAITPTVKAGVAYAWELPVVSSKITPAFDVDVRFENRRIASQFNLGAVSFDSHLGMEYEFKKVVAVRVGADVGKFTAGAGIKLPRLNLDYAFLSHDELGDTHRISLKLTLEEKRFARKNNK